MVNLPLWQDYIERVAGFVLPSTQYSWITHAVETTAAKYNITPSELYAVIEHDELMTQSLLDEVLITESRFFRHMPSLEFISALYKNTLPKHQQFSVWSVGSSSGQEVYSVAVILQRIYEQSLKRLDFMIYGSDLSNNSLCLARLARYSERQINAIPAEYHRYLNVVQDMSNGEKYWQISDKVMQKTHFFWQNLFLCPPINIPKLDIILCQNVLIYFRKFDQRDILAYFVQNLAVGGYVLLAPNEAIFWQHPKMKRVEHHLINAWQKIAD